MSDLRSIENEWQSPSAIWRSAPFWSWNSELEPERLQAEVQMMHDAGMGGAFMHSRYGLKTPYLSERWFECVSAVVEKCRELGMHAYMYDEDRWPSGPAGGFVTREHPQHRLKYLSANFDAPDPNTDKVHAVFDVLLDDEGRLVSYEKIGGPGEIMKAEDAHPKNRALFFCPGMQEVSGWTNDGGYLDTLSPEAVAKFIEITHEAYAARYADEMGTIIPAVFTDEPSYGAQIHGGNRVPWTCILTDEFEQRRGYDLRDYLPEVFLPLADGGCSRARYDYFRTIMELFVEAFSKQIGEWCDEHGIAATGHMLAEQTIASQRQADGACMPHYEYMQWPGIDMLRDQMNELTTTKQCTSVAAQLGKERVLSETYGCTGWDWPLEGHKFSGDWQWTCGVNFRCPHLTHYSLAGGAKRDYPASIRDHSPWWPHYRAVEDYFARLSLMLTQGKPIRDVLVIHPVESGWCHTADEAGREAMAQLEEQLERVVYALSDTHYDWDFGDESLLVKYGSVEDDHITVGQMAYQLVVVPPAVTMRSTTLDLLERFAEAGGEVLFVGEIADYVDAQPDPRAADLASKTRVCCCDAKEFVSTVEAILPRRVSITSDGAEAGFTWTMLREVEGGRLLFISSHDREQARTVQVSVEGDAPVVAWDCKTGERVQVAADAADGRVSFELLLPQTGSALLSLGIDCPDAAEPRNEPEVISREEIGGPFEIKLSEPNTLPLDYCRYRIGDGEWSEPVPVLKADALIRAEYGLEKRFGSNHQPWYLYATGVVDTAPRGECGVLWSFHVTQVPENCHLALENPEDYTITVNGAAISEVDGCWVDDDIETIDISGLLQEGDNEIELSFTYRPNMEIEDAYLVGDFGVKSLDGAARPGSMTVIAQPGKLSEGSWVGQGLATYGGAVRYRISVEGTTDGSRVRVSLPELSCTAAVIHAGDEQFVLPWAPFAADITDALSEGTNDVWVEVIGGRHNIFGPLHTPWEGWTGPGEFDPDNPKWRFDYYLNDHGLMGPVVVERMRV